MLVAEKVIQHTFVTLAFIFDWQSIRESVTVNPNALMVLGAAEAVFFAICLRGLVKGFTWELDALISLAWLDIIGEMLAQGRVIIAINVSFVVAVALLILVPVYRRKLNKKVQSQVT